LDFEQPKRNNWNRQREIERFAWNRGKEDFQLQVSAKDVPGKEICRLPGQLTPSGSTNPGRDFFRKNSLTKSKTLDKSTRQEKIQPVANKRYSQCGYLWSSKHLVSFTTFVLA
jgi:hypothetical protein